MSILNQLDTGMPCPKDIEKLKTSIENREGKSLFQYIQVHAFVLAKVLDRLEYLERYEKFIQGTLSKGIPYK